MGQSRSGRATENVDTGRGLAFAVTAYLLWGFLPIYMKALSHVPAAEVVAHRILWSVPVAGALLIVLGRTNDIRVALRSPRTLAMGALTAGLISINWAIYVWAIASGNALEAALGYYINPLFSFLLGALLLGERLSAAQIVAIVLAAAAVAVLAYDAGTLPWAAVGLTLSWGDVRVFQEIAADRPESGFSAGSSASDGSRAGLCCLSRIDRPEPFCSRLRARHRAFAGMRRGDGGPLIVYANGAKLLRLSTIGILQYIAPTLIFLVAVLVFDEPFGQARMIAFPMIWAALVIYSVSLVRQMRRPAR